MYHSSQNPANYIWGTVHTRCEVVLYSQFNHVSVSSRVLVGPRCISSEIWTHPSILYNLGLLPPCPSFHPWSPPVGHAQNIKRKVTRWHYYQCLLAVCVTQFPGRDNQDKWTSSEGPDMSINPYPYIIFKRSQRTLPIISILEPTSWVRVVLSDEGLIDELPPKMHNESSKIMFCNTWTVLINLKNNKDIIYFYLIYMYIHIHYFTMANSLCCLLLSTMIKKTRHSFWCLLCMWQMCFLAAIAEGCFGLCNAM